MHRVETISSQIGYRKYCHLERSGDAAILILHHELLNALTTCMRAAIQHYFLEAEADPSVRCIIIAGDGSAFSCGVDITDFKASVVQTSLVESNHNKDNDTRDTNTTNHIHASNKGKMVTMYDKSPTDTTVPSLAALTNMVERSSKVVIAAIHGIAYSGGLELALAAHYRVAAPSALFSFPEVQLGIVPCGGGTQRLPRLIRLREAMAMIASSTKVGADAALDMGLIDHLAREESAMDSAGIIAAALRLAPRWTAPSRLSERQAGLGTSLANRALLRWARREVLRKAPRGVTAPMRCLAAIRAALTSPNFAAGLAAERSLFLQAMASPEAHAMQHLLRASYAPLGENLAALAEGGARALRRIGVVGCGTVGTGVVLLALRARVAVTVVELNAAERQRARRVVRMELDRDVQEGRLSVDLRPRLDALLTMALFEDDLVQALRGAELVVECVGEDAELKRRVLVRLDAACAPQCVLASSTSSLSIGDLAAATRRPEKVIGMHFIPPSDVTPLLEIMQGSCTERATVAQAMRVGRLFHKSVMVINDSFACVTTRLIARASYQALAMLEEGSFPVEVDRAMRRFGFRMGIFALDDLAGVDFTARLRAALQQPSRSSHSSHKRPPRLAEEPPFFPATDIFAVQRRLLEEGRFGQKTGRGWYNYEHVGWIASTLAKVRETVSGYEPHWGVWRKGGASLRLTPWPDRQVELMILDVCQKKNILRRDINEHEIVERVIFSMINEAAKILSEGVVTSSSVVDVVVTFGYGFPAWKGGLCYYADKFGIANVVHRMRIYNRAFGDDVFPPPCPQLLAMVAAQQTFGSKWP